MYGWENALYANGLMSPWQNSWGGAAQDIVQKEVAPALGLKTQGENGPFSGYSTPGDPNAAAQTSQATKDRVADSLSGSLGKSIGRAGLNTGMGLAMGMPTGMMGSSIAGSLASPSSIGGVLGGALNSAIGTTPQGFMGKAIANFGVPALAGLALGPVGGLVGGLMGGVVADGIGDAFDVRSREDVRDDYEAQSGPVSGRMAYGDRLGLENTAAGIRGAVPNSMAAIHAMDEAIAATRALEQRYGINPTYGMNPGGSMQSRSTYGGWDSIGGPAGGARAVDAGYGANMGGYAGLGIGNPSSYGGGSGGSSGGDRGGFGANDGDSDTAGNGGYGR